MKRLLGPCLAIALCAGLSTVNAETMRTEAPCSPIVDRTQGNVTINFTGGCTAGISPTQLQQIVHDVLNKRSVPLESFRELAQQFGVTDTAVKTFLRILGERNVTTEDLDSKLREIASRHLTLLKQIETLPSEDPHVERLKTEAMAAIRAGNYANADALLQQAFDADLVAARKAQDAASQRLVTAARTKAHIGQLKLSQLQYKAAAREFQTAADLVPVSEQLLRAQYLDRSGSAALSAGDYSSAESTLIEALRIREKMLSPDNTQVANSLSRLALLHRAQGRYADAEHLAKRALTIREKAFARTTLL